MRILAITIFLLSVCANANASLGKPNFEKYQEAWQSAAPMSKDDLGGVWIANAIAVNPECKRMGRNVYDPNGLRNYDGSLAFMLQFFFWPYQNGPDMYVNVYHLGAYYLNQGAYRISDKEPFFATYGYIKNTNQMALDSKFEWSCRETELDFQMLCSLNFIYDKETKDPICTIQDSAVFFLYSRYSN